MNIQINIFNDCLLIYDNNNIIGNLKFEIMNDELFIKNYTIFSNYRKKGISDIVFNNLLFFCKNKIKKIKLVAKELFSNYNKLVNLYSKYGFQIIEENKKIKSRWIDGELYRFIEMELLL